MSVRETVRDIFDRYKGLLAAITTTATVSYFVAVYASAPAEKKADAAAQALLEVAKTQTALAETQKALGEKVARQDGRFEGLLATLNLDPAQLAHLKALPRQPKRLPSDSTKLLCGQTWISATANLDTILVVTITDSCKVSTWQVYPEAKR